MQYKITEKTLKDISMAAKNCSCCAQLSFSENYLVFPGFVDVHVHLRQPGFFYKETIESGTLAAACGGFTTVCSMPNLNPVPDTYDNLKIQLDLIKENAKIQVIPYASITKNQNGKELSDMENMKDYVIGFSDDGKGIQNSEIMRKAMLHAKKLNKPIVAHCEDNRLLSGGYIHAGEYAKRHGHKGISSESEWAQIKRDINLLKETGCKYHVCHVSTKESVALIREAKSLGLDITCETAAHYLILNDLDLKEEGRFKMNPPIRSEKDRLALIEGICDGTIDMLATDHAPHSAAEKSKGLEKSLMGVVGLECAFPVMYTHFVKTGIITLEKLITLMSINPRKRFNIGNENDLCIWDLNENYRINPDNFLSMGRATPFENFEVYGKCKLTISGGKIAYIDN